jgi:two-component system, chemotaxis family, protein-glutamate methylesterase/glutaminase
MRPGRLVLPGSHSPHFDLVVLGASAGGLAAVSSVLASLPADFPAPIVVVQHRSVLAPALFADILSRRTPLRVKPGEAGEVPRAGTVYVAPPIVHLSIGLSHAMEISEPTARRRGAASADALFSSAATVYGRRLVAVVLSGTGRDGSAGAQAVDLSGGTVLAQDESTSGAFGMPSAAIATGGVDAVLPVDELGPALIRLLSTGKLALSGQ